MTTNFIKQEDLKKFEEKLSTKFQFVKSYRYGLKKGVIVATHNLLEQPLNDEIQIQVYKNKIDGLPDLTLNASNVRRDEENNLIIYDEILMDKTGQVLMADVAITREMGFYVDGSRQNTDNISAVTGNKFTGNDAMNINVFLHGEFSNIKNLKSLPENLMQNNDVFVEVISQIKASYVKKVEKADNFERLEKIVESYKNLTQSLISQKYKHSVEKFKDKNFLLDYEKKFIQKRMEKIEQDIKTFLSAGMELK